MAPACGPRALFSATGLTFGGFAVRMALPTLAAASVVVGTAVRTDGEDTPATAPAEPPEPVHLDGFARFVVGALAALMVAFFVGSAIGIEPAWIALAGAAVVGAVAIVRRRARPVALLASSAPLFLLFVLALAVVVDAAVSHGLGDAARDVLPHGDGLLALLAMTANRPRRSSWEVVGCFTNATLTVQAGTVLAVYGGSGIYLWENGSLVCSGFPTNYVHLCHFYAVQELSTNWGGNAAGAST